jgi:hypothetical protein
VPVSTTTAQRYVCAAGTVPILFDQDEQVVNVGRDQRLFTRRQRIGMAARDGGCVWPGCDRPPSWCEAHHIDEWDAHHGRMDIADGVLLCRFHHLMVHDRGWRIHRGIGVTSPTVTTDSTAPTASTDPAVTTDSTDPAVTTCVGTDTLLRSAVSPGTDRGPRTASGAGPSPRIASEPGRVRYWARREPTGPPGRVPTGRPPHARAAREPEFVELQARPPIRHGPG